MSDLIDVTAHEPDAGTPALVELKSNLQYARGMVQGGRSLHRLQIGAFDVTDLYRAAWVQAVSSLDHWVHRELYDRAVAIASRSSAERPRRFLAIRVPMDLLEAVHHRSEDLAERFRAHLQVEFGRSTFQQPDDIKAAFGHVFDDFGWPAVASRIVVGDQKFDSAEVKKRLTATVWRRNAIAHSTDRDPVTGRRTAMSAEEAADAIDWVERIATAIVDVLGPLPKPDQPRKTSSTAKKRWTRADVEAAAATEGPAVEKVVQLLLGHGDRFKARFNGGVGAAPSAGMYYPTRISPRSLWSIYVTPDRPSLSLNLALISGIDQAVSRRFLADLRRVPALDDALLGRDDDMLGRYPTLYLAVLAESDEAMDALLTAYDRVVEGVS